MNTSPTLPRDAGTRRSSTRRGPTRDATTSAEPASGALILDLAARQRMLNERFVKELLARLVGAEAAPDLTLRWLRGTVDALVDGGVAAKTLGPEPTWVELPPPATQALAKLFEEERRALDALEEDATALMRSGADEAARHAGVARVLEASRRFFTIANQATTELAQHLDAEKAMLEGRLADALRRMAEESSHVSENALRLRATSGSLTEATTSTATAAQAVAAASEQVDRNIGAVAAATEEMSACIREIAKSASQASQIAGVAVSTTQRADDTIARLGDAGKQIDRVVTMITTIAGQTNLLALNAMIEAARAGDAGRGFTVVANEVKQLSRETATATAAVGGQVETIHREIAAVVGALGEIRGVVEKVDAIAGVIAAAVEEQTATTREIARSVSEAAAGASDISRNIHGVAESAARASNAAEIGAEATTDMSRATDELRSLLASLGAGSSR